MKKIFPLLLFALGSASFYLPDALMPYYNPEYVEISSTVWDGDKYVMVSMRREEERVKAKYFAARDFDGTSVPDRYNKWAAGKNIILVCSGTYMNNSYQPVGLTIDNGIMVNNTLSDEFDGLVIVEAVGGIRVSNLEEGNIYIKCNGEDKYFNIRNTWDIDEFIDCAKSVEATVFQTHLLVWKNELQLKNTSGCKAEPCERERRFLAVCKDEDGKLRHIIVHSPTYSTLYQGTNKVLRFLREFKDMQEVVFMINLDTGYQDFFTLYDKNGNVKNDIKGEKTLDVAVNLLAYYFQ